MTTLTKSDIALIDDLIDSRKNAIDSQSKLIVEHCRAYQNNQPCNQTLIKNALKLFRADKKVKAYQAKIDTAEKRQSTQQRKEKARTKFLIGNAMLKLFDDEFDFVMIKMIAYSQTVNEKDRQFLLSNVEVKHKSDDVSNLIYRDENKRVYQLTITKLSATKTHYKFYYEHAYEEYEVKELILQK